MILLRKRRKQVLEMEIFLLDAASFTDCSGRFALCRRLREVFSRSHDAVIRVYDDAGNVVETHEARGRFQRVVNCGHAKASEFLTLRVRLYTFSDLLCSSRLL
jgi:hypothetical protein